MSRFIVSIHDVAPSTAEASRRWLELLEARGIRVSLLAVPGEWNGADVATSPAFAEWLRQAESRGHEIVMHGYSHTRLLGTTTTRWREAVGAVLARGCEEFWHLPYGRARELLSRGQEILRREGLSPRGFIAPGWLMSPDSVEAARHVGFDYACTHTSIIDLQRRLTETAFTTSQRPGSPLSRPTVGFNRVVAGIVSHRMPTLRIAIHPQDLFDERLRDANLALCDGAARGGRKSFTYGETVPPMVAGRGGHESTGRFR